MLLFPLSLSTPTPIQCEQVVQFLKFHATNTWVSSNYSENNCYEICLQEPYCKSQLSGDFSAQLLDSQIPQ